jgi:iron complex transport system ATP-binding protein
MLEAVDVSLTRGGNAILDRVGLRVAPGEVVAIVGPNGAGKSTLLHILSGELKPDSGTVKLSDRPVSSFKPRDLALRRAVLAQHVQVTFPFTVDEIVHMGAGERRGDFVDREVEQALNATETTHLRGRIVGTLSGGEQQRVHIARVMVQVACGRAAMGPGFMMLDEPTSSLDMRHQIDLARIATAHAGDGIGIIAVLHDLNLAVQLAHRIVVMQAGRIVADGPAQETITADLVERVFRLKGAVSERNGYPVVLPMLMQA